MFALIVAQFEFITDAAAFLDDHTSGDTIVVFNPSGDHPDPDQSHDGCDHCCHGASHMTAIAVSMQAIVSQATASFQLTVPVDRTSLALTPPIRPPIV